MLALPLVATCALPGFAGGWSAAFTADANESFDTRRSGLMVIGFDRGEGVTIRFAASDELRGGIFTSLAGSAFEEDGSAAAAAVGTFGAVEPLPSRLVPELDLEWLLRDDIKDSVLPVRPCEEPERRLFVGKLRKGCW